MIFLFFFEIIIIQTWGERKSEHHVGEEEWEVHLNTF